jgi:hypothetical protein
MAIQNMVKLFKLPNTKTKQIFVQPTVGLLLTLLIKSNSKKTQPYENAIVNDL